MYRESEEHPNFQIVPVENGFALYFVEDGDFQEQFGVYKTWQTAEKEARKMQRWADAEGF